MNRQYSIAEARVHLPALVDEVQDGGEIEITRRGKTVAFVISGQTYDRLRSGRRDFSEAYAAFLGRHDLSEVGADAADFTGLRDKTPGRNVRL